MSNKIRMRINQNIDSNSTNEVYTDLYFYLNGNYFNSVTRLNAFTGLEDTIASYETENSYIKDISHEYLLGYYYTYFNFEFNNGNIIKFKNGYTNFFGWQYVDSIMVSYNSYLTQNISKAPFQYIGYSYTYYSLPPVHLIDILFLLGINNYYPYQPNRNLIANINNISQYTYSINNNLLNDMNIINNITNFNQDIHFEYY
ncbi:MAG: hypothetical protein H6553_10170 [Chitinophagales bacterium]|nr:hypothetical protein [Chitinophagales bacterium]